MRKQIIIALVLLVAFTVRLPSLFANLPFFYHEDEAHHFNRLTRMIKTGELNPQYFHKPSLHFYLRLPVYGIAFLNEVRRGTIKEVGEINTKDPNGVGGYSFSASHQALVVWQRAYSLLFSMGSIFLAMLLAYRLGGGSVLAMGLTGALIAFSPMHARLSSFIGVDVVMTFFCLLTTWWALRSVTEQKFSFTIVAALAAGAAISSKYNAFPIAIVPLISCLTLRRWSTAHGMAIVGLIGVAFLACSPFIIVSIPLFLNQFAYEVWHYGVEGHAGHSAAPGFGQLQFYLLWLMNDGLGILGTVGMIIGAFLLAKRESASLVLLSFPLLFACLMIAQKTNFERNMLVFLPYAACLAGIACGRLLEHYQKRGVLFATLAGLALVVQPAILTLGEAYATVRSPKESRIELTSYLGTLPTTHSIAVDAELQPHSKLLAVRGVERVDTIAVELLIQRGFDMIVSGTLAPTPFLTKLFQIGSGDPRARVLQNPQLIAYQTNTHQFYSTLPDESLVPTITMRNDSGVYRCNEQQEPYCWTSTRLSKLSFDTPPPPGANLALTVLTPWENQRVSLQAAERKWVSVPAGSFQTITLPISTNPLYLATDIVRKPSTFLRTTDDRFLGVAIKEIKIQ